MAVRRTLLAVGIAVALAGPVTVVAAAPAAGQADVCSVSFDQYDHYAGGAGSHLDGFLSCQNTGIVFAGSATGNPNLCPGSAKSAVTYRGSQHAGSDPDVAASWTLTGASGGYELAVTDASGRKWTGAVSTAGVPVIGLACGAADVQGQGAAVQTAGGAAATPDVYVCSGSGSVTFTWGSGESGRVGLGGTTGAGTCHDGTAKTWSLRYTGSWTLPEDGFQTKPCPADFYDVTLTLHSGSSTRTVQQIWSSNVYALTQSVGGGLPDAGPAMTASTETGVPVGGGTLTKSRQPCADRAGGSFTTAQRWAFVDA